MAQATEMSKPQKKVQNYMLGNDFKLFEVKAEEPSLGEYFGETQYLPTFEVLVQETVATFSLKIWIYLVRTYHVFMIDLS
jgi:hypothetical protein